MGTFVTAKPSKTTSFCFITNPDRIVTKRYRSYAIGAAARPHAPSEASNAPQGKSLFSDASLAKNISRGQNNRDIHVSSQNEYAAGNNPILRGEAANGQQRFDRFLNLGVLSAGTLLLTAALSTGTSPWQTYQDAVAINPIETKACISGIVYSLGDIIAQSYEGRDVAEWDRGRIIRSGLCGLLAHGPLSHLYYVGLDHFFSQQTFIPTGSWLVPLIKVGIDQTVWSLVWNSSYYVLLGLLKMEPPKVIAATVHATWWDLLKAGWRLWPLVHVFTYGVIPVQHRVLFVDAVELVWVSILSIYGQQQRSETFEQPTWVACPLPGADGEGGDPVEEILRGIQVQSEVVFENAAGERVVLSPAEVYADEPVPVEFRLTSAGNDHVPH